MQSYGATSKSRSSIQAVPYKPRLSFTAEQEIAIAVNDNLGI